MTNGNMYPPDLIERVSLERVYFGQVVSGLIAAGWLRQPPEPWEVEALLKHAVWIVDEMIKRGEAK